jgi:DNA invertase Pin-like site-specific DNA recombinase
MSARRTAISYTRFSDPKQAKGDSQDRQASMFKTFCGQHGLTPLTEVYADKGKSGFKDEHRKNGRLGVLIAEAKAGRFEPGTVIVVEAWDRLGRLRPDRQTELVAELLRIGINIGVCRLNEIFTEEDFGSHKWTTLAVFIQLAYQESKQKSDRGAASWVRRRERARAKKGTLIGGRLPAWVERPDPAADTLRLVPDRVATVRRIFELAAGGHGYNAIIKRLTDDRVPVFGEVVVRPDRVRSAFCGRWTRPYLAMILNDRRVVGEHQPRKADGTPDGKPLADYYPAAVPEQLFLLARAAQGDRATGGKPKVRQRTYVNVFRSLLVHARDGEAFVLHNRGSAAKPDLILVNATGYDGRAKSFTLPYPVFETCILSELAELKPRDVLPAVRGKPSREAVLRAKLKNVRADMAGLQADLREGYSKAIAMALREKEAEEIKLADQLQDELARSVRPAARAFAEVPGLVEMIRTAADPDAVRLKLRVALQQTVESIHVLIVPIGAVRLCVVEVRFMGGWVRSYLVYHRSAANQRPALTWIQSYRDDLIDDIYTLTNREHVERVASGFAKLPPDELAQYAAAAAG